MNLDDLKTFLDVAELGVFSRASAHRRIAQSALSRRVARLEHQLGVQLFERRARGVQLTEHGMILFDRARDLAQLLTDIEHEVQDLSSQPQGAVRIAIPPTTAIQLAPRIVKDMRRQFPAIHLSIREGSNSQTHARALSGEVDIALL